MRERSKAHHQGLENAFKPLRDHIEHEKALFYNKHAKAIEKLIQKRVEEGVKRKLPGIVRVVPINSIVLRSAGFFSPCLCRLKRNLDGTKSTSRPIAF